MERPWHPQGLLQGHKHQRDAPPVATPATSAGEAATPRISGCHSRARECSRDRPPISQTVHHTTPR
eukprot:934220-Pyramimonas_sp.AAC.1